MKKSIATVISVAGVLGAGAAAYAVNSSVLSATSSNNLAAATVPTFAQSAAAVVADTDLQATDGGVGASGSEAVAPLAAPASTTTAPPATVAPLSSTQVPASTRTSYKVGSAGTVVLDSADGVLTIAGVNPAANWTATRTAGGARTATVHFTSATMRVEFVATLSNGSIGVNVNSVSRQPPAATRPHDDDDDRYEDHDDRHEDHEDHDDEHEDREDD